MPVALNGSVPLPSVRVYTSVTVLLMSACLYYALIMTSDPNWRQHTNMTSTAGGGSTSTTTTTSTTSSTATAGAPASTASGGPVIDGAVEGAGGKLGDVSAGASLLSVKEIDTLEEKILAAADLSDLRQMLHGANEDGSTGGNSDGVDDEDDEDEDDRWLMVGNDTRTVGAYLKDTVSFMATEPFCIWPYVKGTYGAANWIVGCTFRHAKAPLTSGNGKQRVSGERGFA
uniref:Uncharacterized protein n=1 Tax=Anopheles farauti TaxID=69004 RepID=A0A182QJC5_9DIPT